MNTPATGYAAATQPVASQTQIATDTRGLEAGEVRVRARDGEQSAYRAKPQGATNVPVVLVVQEIFGLHEHIRDVCRRLAKEGYLAIAPDLYARQGDVTKLANLEDIRAVMGRVPDEQVLADLDACAQWAGSNGGDLSRLAVTGFCWGGRITWLYAAHNRKVRAGVAWYGKVEGPASALQPKMPVDVVDRIDAPILGLYGGADAGIPNDSVDRMRAALKRAGKPSEIHTYPDTPHAFHADYRPSYRKEPAEDGWRRMLAWFRQHGVA